MHIETLKVFCGLAELRSFSKTAEKYFLSQSAVSQQLGQLEMAHNCQLINRKRRPIEMTREGQLLYKAAKDIIERYEVLKGELNSLKTSTENRVNVAAIFSIGMHALPEYVKTFMVNYPDVNVHVEYLEAEKIYDGVIAGDIDIGVVAIPRKDKRLHVYDFQNESLVFVCGPKHPFAGKNEIDIHQLQFERFIAFEEQIPSRIWIDSILQSYNITTNPVMQFDNIETIKRAVEINSGVSILPKNAILQELQTGTLKAIELADEKFVRPTGIIVRKNKILSRATKYFIDLLKGHR